MKDTRKLYKEIVASRSMAEGRRLIAKDRNSAFLSALQAIQDQAVEWAFEKDTRHPDEKIPFLLRKAIEELDRVVDPE